LYLDPKRYWKLFIKLNYLPVTHSDIVCAVSVTSHFLTCQEAWDAVVWILGYIKNTLDKDLIYEDKENTQIVFVFFTDLPFP